MYSWCQKAYEFKISRTRDNEWITLKTADAEIKFEMEFIVAIN